MAEKNRFRTKCLRVKVCDEELEIAKRKAEYCGLTMSDFIRKQIVEGVIIKYERFDIKVLANELNKIGVNVNQIARHVNERGGEYDRQDMDNLVEEFKSMQDCVYKAIWGLE